MEGGAKGRVPLPALRQAMAVAGLSLGCTLDGMVIAYSSPAIPSLLEDGDIEANYHHASWIGSIHTLGAVLGCLIAVPAMQRFGRRGATLTFMAMAYLLGFLFIGAAAYVEMIIAGRFLGGIGLGLTLSITPVYLVEVTGLKIRGMLGVVPPLLTQIGLFATYLAGSWLDWRNLGIAGAFSVVPFVIIVWVIPESPVHLINVGKVEEAKHSLAALGRVGEINMMIKEKEIDDQLKTLGPKPSFRKVYLSANVLKPFLACLGLMFFFQATGYNTIIAYAAQIFKESGSSISEDIATGITGGVILSSALIALGLARITRRKTLLVISSIGSSKGLFLIGMYYYLKNKKGEEFTLSWSWVPLVTLVSVIFFFMIGYGALAWTVMAEMLPKRVRGNLYPFTVAFSWICNFGFAKSFVYIQLGIGSFAAFWLYSALTLTGMIFIHFCIPETRERSPEEIASYFSSLESSRTSSQESVLSEGGSEDERSERIV